MIKKNFLKKETELERIRGRQLTQRSCNLDCDYESDCSKFHELRGGQEV